MKIIIIGAGPGGYETALLAAKRGVEVVLIEAGHVGGTCLNEGCIPTKSFCKNAEVIDSLREAEAFGITGLSYDFDFKAVTARKNTVVEQLRGGVEGLLGHKLITLVRGKASFKDAHTVVVTRTSTSVIPSEAEGSSVIPSEAEGSYVIPSEAEGRVEESPCYRVTYIRKGKEETVEADNVLMAVGRKANVGSLNLADAGIEFTPRGILVNDKTMQTNVPHIYAIGDVNGKMMLAHAATFQGIVALDHIMGIENEIDLSVMPAAVFTSPEAASVGMTEDECKEAGIPVKCLKSFFRANGKAVTMGETDGFCKLIVAAGPKEGCVSPLAPGRILGCHLYGPHASDIVQEACALISRNATLKEFESIIHTHPTLTEVLQSAVHG